MGVDSKGYYSLVILGIFTFGSIWIQENPRVFSELYRKMWLIHFPLNNILTFISPVFFLLYLHKTDSDLQTTDLKRKPGPTTYKGPGSP